MSGTSRKVSTARSVTSPRFPIGVATTNRTPPARPDSDGSPVTPAPNPVAAGDRDSRRLPLELGAGDEAVDPLHERRIEAELGHLLERPPLVDPPEEQPVEDGVAEPALDLVGLTGPQIGGRRLPDDGVRHAERDGQLADLALVQVADGVECARGIPEQRRV